MRAVVQRSKESRVMIGGLEVARIKAGLMVLLGIGKGDQQADGLYLMDKMINLRIFEDDEGKMNRSLLEAGGEILMVSQFTLYGDARKGRRPSFSGAEEPHKAEPLFDFCMEYLRSKGLEVQTGVFGADMQVYIENEGPVTILLDSQKTF